MSVLVCSGGQRTAVAVRQVVLHVMYKVAVYDDNEDALQSLMSSWPPCSAVYIGTRTFSEARAGHRSSRAS